MRMTEEAAMSRYAMVLLACALGGCGAGSAAPAADAGGLPVTAGADAAAGVSASYVVPAGPDTPETSYPVANVKTEVNDGVFRVDYHMPKLLVGNDQQISLRGPLDAAGRIATVSGDAGTAACDLMPGNGLALRCNEMLTGIVVDVAGVRQIAQTTAPSSVDLYVAVAARFSGEPIGALELR